MQKQLLFTLLSLTSITPSLAEQTHYQLTANTELIIERGDITNCPVEAIVNAANPQLQGGGGVCGAIFQAAGQQQLQQACDQYPLTNGYRCPVGQARITPSYQLKSRSIDYVIHAVGPDCRIIHDPKQQDQLLEAAYRNALLLAKQHHIKSIAFPFISSAIYAFPKARAAQIALAAIRTYAATDTPIKSIRFVLFSAADYELFCQIQATINAK